jgi:8-oxo-dGTP pyrophosphatase MutT (NUDIX family)
VEVWLDNVELPDGRRVEHNVLKFPRPSVTAVVVDGRDRTLMLWRHRYITDAWGWEIPAGWADPGEDLADAARREVEEETGYRPGRVQPLVAYNALSGISTIRFNAFLVSDAVRLGPPRDRTESTRVEWLPLVDIPKLAEAGQISDGPSLTALSYYLGIYRTLDR